MLICFAHLKTNNGNNNRLLALRKQKKNKELATIHAER